MVWMKKKAQASIQRRQGSGNNKDARATQRRTTRNTYFTVHADTKQHRNAPFRGPRQDEAETTDTTHLQLQPRPRRATTSQHISPGATNVLHTEPQRVPKMHQSATNDLWPDAAGHCPAHPECGPFSSSLPSPSPCALRVLHTV
jgi:hypothetical protein